MPERAWAEVIEGLLTGRTQPPRKNGLTMVIDKGLGPAATADLFEMCGGVIDHWKCAFGTSAFVPADALRRKLVSLAAHGILTYPGGTLLEVAIVVGSCWTFMRRAHSLGFSAVEISDGTIPLPSHRRQNVIRCALDHWLTPITEVGKKDATQQPTAIELAEQALQDLAWGAQWVTVEARGEGLGIGIYDDHGAVRAEAVADLDAAAQVILNRPLRLPEAVFAQALDPASAVAARQGIGGAAAEPLAAMLAKCSAGLDACTTWQKKAFTSAESAEEALLRYSRSFVEVYHARLSH